MENIVFIDTHIVLWLYGGEIKLLSQTAKRTIQNNKAIISPFVILELQFLLEIGRIKEKPSTIVNTLEKEIGLKIKDTPTLELIEKAKEINWTRDPFDRLITAQAIITNKKLITRDQSILDNFQHSLW